MKLYVGNLPFTATEDEIRTLFANSGTVNAVNLVRDRETGASRGFAFVEMGNNEEANQAINRLNGSQFAGRTIRVSEAREREERTGGSFSPRPGGDRRGPGGPGGGRPGGGPRRDRRSF